MIKHDSEKRRFDLNEINHDNEETKFCDFILETQIVNVTIGHKKYICFFFHYSGSIKFKLTYTGKQFKLKNSFQL